MKKFYIALIFLFSSTCTTIQSENSFDLSFLEPIDGLEIKNRATSYMFFIEKQRVFIKGNTDSDNSWYHLIEGRSSNKEIVSYQLNGDGVLNKNYIAILLKTENQQTKVSVSLQSTRNSAINAINNSSITTLTLGEKRLSSAMYILYSIPTWVQISRAGIFNPTVDINYMNFQNQGTEIVGDAINHVELNVTTIAAANQTITPHDPIVLTFQTNVSTTISIYSFVQGSVNILLGVSLNLDHPFPKIHIMTNNAGNAGILPSSLDTFAKILINNTFWEYASLEFIQSSDGFLEPFKNKTWVRISSKDKYNPINTEFWEFDPNAHTVNLERSLKGKTEIEKYVLELTDVPGIYKFLNNSENPIKPHKYLNQYIAVKTTENTTLGQITIGDSIQDVQKMINDNTDNITIQSLDTLQPLPLTIIDQVLTSTAWGNVGRSGFVAYESNGRIYIIGGQTNSFELLSSRPRLPVPTLPLTEQIPVYNDIYYIDKITDPNFSTINFTSVSRKLDNQRDPTLNNRPSFQQAVGGKVSQEENDTRFITVGFGSNGQYRLSNLDLMQMNENNSPSTYVLDPRFNNIYHGAFLIHKNNAYIFGGTTATAPGGLGDAASPEVFGTYNQDIYYSSIYNNFNTWTRTPPNPTSTLWSPRTHAKVFSIDNDIILVGGYTQATDGVSSTPVNDVWISSDDGKTWKMVNDGLNPTTAPPKQVNNNEGPLAGTSYGKLLFLVDKTGKIYYSIDRGTTWQQTGQFQDSPPIFELYGAQLVAYDKYLYLLGGQTSEVNPVNITIEENMSKKIYRVQYNFN